MFAYTLGEEKLLRDHALSQFLCILRDLFSPDNFAVFPHECIAFSPMKTERHEISCRFSSGAAFLARMARGYRGQPAATEPGSGAEDLFNFRRNFLVEPELNWT
ncbi:MAG: hypothetical protein WCA37_17560 [Terracidiphilus sp.]